MFKKLLKFNIKLSPFYIVLALILVGGIVLTGDKETYLSDMAAVIAQVALVLLLPNSVYTVRHRKENGSFLAFLCMLPIIPLPFIFVASMLWVFYF